MRSARDQRAVARRIEAKHPELRHGAARGRRTSRPRRAGARLFAEGGRLRGRRTRPTAQLGNDRRRLANGLPPGSFSSSRSACSSACASAWPTRQGRIPVSVRRCSADRVLTRRKLRNRRRSRQLRDRARLAADRRRAVSTWQCRPTATLVVAGKDIGPQSHEMTPQPRRSEVRRPASHR